MWTECCHANKMESITFVPKLIIMINHVVLFKIKDCSDPEKKEIRNKIKTSLEALKSRIKELKHIEVGLDDRLTPPSFDICLITHFDNMTDMDLYQNHPEHQEVLKYIRANIVARSAVDYTF